MVIGFVVLLITSSLAFYYRSQAVFFQREYNAVMAQHERMNAAIFPVEPSVSQRERELKPAHVLRKVDRRPSPQPDAQVVVPVRPVAMADVATSLRSSDSERFRRRPSDWRENLRTNDPQRYAEFQQRRQQMQRNMQNAWTQASDYFLNRDTSAMAPSDQDEYRTMMALLGQASSLNQQLQSGLPSDVRQQVVADLRSNVVAVAPLLENERNREYFDMAVAMGQSEADAATLVSYINQIASNTSLRIIIPGVRVGGIPGGAH